MMILGIHMEVNVKGNVKIDGQDTLLEVRDLLYAHGMLCDYAMKHKLLDHIFASRLCDVINNFQDALRPYLKSDACDFHEKRDPTGYSTVEPIGGWDA